MRYHLVAVGRVKDPALRAACDEYLERLRHYTQVEVREVKEDRVLETIPEDARLVALSRTGKPWSSRALATETARWDMEGRDVVFAIGGADALGWDVLERAETLWSLSPLTLPHEVARLVVLEQLYRAHTIRRG